MIDPKEFRGAQSIAKALILLKAFRCGRELDLDELVGMLKWGKSTIHRMLRVMVALGFLSQDPLTKKYRLGVAAFELGQVAAEQIELRREARPILQELNESTGETIHLSTLVDGDVLCLEKLDSPGPIRLISRVGARGSLHSTGSGKALLAFLDEEERNAILASRPLTRMTGNTITDRAQLEIELAQIRLRGYSIDNGENQEQVKCVAAPVFDHSGKVVAAISISGPEHRMTADRIPFLAEQVVEAAARLSAQLGYRKNISPTKAKEFVEI